MVAETYKRMKQQKEEALEQRRRKKQQEEQSYKIVDFLKKNNFDTEDVNSIAHKKGSCFGLLQSHHRPLHQAAKDQNAEMVLLLLQYGADPSRKDSKGNTAYDYVKSGSLRSRMCSLRVKVRAQGEKDLVQN